MKRATSFAAYARSAKQVADDLRAFEQDLLLIESGRKVVYAVDFSEFYGYVLPNFGEALTSRATANLEVSPRTEVLALENLFMGESWDVLLLPAYVLELENFVRRFKHSHFTETLATIVRAYEQLLVLTKSDRHKAFVEDVRGCLLDEGRPIPDDKKRSILAYLSEHAGSLATIVDGTIIQPLARLSHILSSPKLRLLEQSSMYAEPPELYLSGILEKLSERRPGPSAANYSDAHALATIVAMAQDGDGSFYPRLVTRSMHLFKALDAAAADNLVSESSTSVNLLRRPYVFLFALRSDKFRKGVTTMRESLERFWVKYQQTRDADIGESEFAELGRLVTENRNRWREITDIRLLDSVAGDHAEAQNADLVRALKAITGDNSLGRVVRSHVAGMLTVFSRQNDLLTFVVGSARGDEGGPDLANQVNIARGFGSAVQVQSALLRMPIELRFSTDAVAELFERKGESPTSSPETIEDLIGALSRILDTENSDDAEAYLAMAYCFGVLGEWNSALQFVELADRVAVESGVANRAEVLFFLSVCQRRSSLDLEDLRNALRSIDEALVHARTEEPRYVRERGVVVCEWRIAAGPGESEVPSFSEAIEMLEMSIRDSDPDQVRVIALNNICYSLIEYGRRWERGLMTGERAHAMFERFMTTQNRISPGFHDWPTQFVDTYVWAKFWLFPSCRQEEHGEWIALLEETIARPGLGPRSAKELKDHCAQIKSWARISGGATSE